MRLLNESRTRILALAASVLLCSAGFAEAQGSPEEIEKDIEAIDELASKDDKTGTNPINFQREIRFYNEYSWLTSASGENQNVTTAEFRAPFLDGKFQFRSRIRYVKLKADLNNDGSNDIDDNGWGDIDFRFLTVPVFNLKRAQAFAFGFEVFLDTASENAMGAGTTSLGPQIFFDRETQDNYAIIDFEFGVMMTKFFENLKGQSFYLRPSVGVGDGRPWNGSIEVGYKIVGW